MYKIGVIGEKADVYLQLLCTKTYDKKIKPIFYYYKSFLSKKPVCLKIINTPYKKLNGLILICDLNKVNTIYEAYGIRNEFMRKNPKIVCFIVLLCGEKIEFFQEKNLLISKLLKTDFIFSSLYKDDLSLPVDHILYKIPKKQSFLKRIITFRK